MFITHKVFLKWLIYLVVVLFAGSALIFFRIPQLTFAYDHIYLGTALFIMYIAAEILAGKQAVSISRENVATNRLAQWLQEQVGLREIAIDSNDLVLITSAQGSMIALERSFVTDHLRNLITKSKFSAGSPMTQRILLDGLGDKIYFRVLIGDFISARIVWVGILATILGVILAFWPFVGVTGVDIEAIRQNLGPFFRGVAVAFLPTAVSFICKIALDFNTRILMAGANELLDTITMIGEVYVVPLLDRHHKESRAA